MVDLIGSIDREMNAEGVPFSRQLLFQYLELFQMGGGEDLERMVDFERKSTRMAVRLSDNAVRATYAVGRQVHALGEEILEPAAKVEVNGMTYLLGGFLDSIIIGQRNGLLLAFVVIILMMILWLWSLRVGLLSILPNFIPILALAGLVGLRWDTVDSDVIGVAMIAIGIGVDDTIHFLVRLKFESRRTGDTVWALERTFHFTGRAIVITTVILAVGFMPFAMSDYFTINMFGVLIPFTLMMALLADILLVPAMAKLGWLRFRSTST
jgi:predicted RND superfamily exporter protein